jgi:hypothetical protein
MPLARGGARAIETRGVPREPSPATGVDQAALGAQTGASAGRPLGMIHSRGCRMALPAVRPYCRRRADVKKHFRAASSARSSTVRGDLGVVQDPLPPPQVPLGHGHRLPPALSDRQGLGQPSSRWPASWRAEPRSRRLSSRLWRRQAVSGGAENFRHATSFAMPIAERSTRIPSSSPCASRAHGRLETRARLRLFGVVPAVVPAWWWRS